MRSVLWGWMGIYWHGGTQPPAQKMTEVVVKVVGHSSLSKLTTWYWKILPADEGNGGWSTRSIEKLVSPMCLAHMGSPSDYWKMELFIWSVCNTQILHWLKDDPSWSNIFDPLKFKGWEFFFFFCCARIYILDGWDCWREKILHHWIYIERPTRCGSRMRPIHCAHTEEYCFSLSERSVSETFPSPNYVRTTNLFLIFLVWKVDATNVLPKQQTMKGITVFGKRWKG